MLIVIDSNVWISSLVFGGNPRKLFEKVTAEGWTIIISEEIVTEVRRVLGKKFSDFLDDFERLYSALSPRIRIVPLGSITISISRDEDDNRVIETAVIGKASCIVSGDKDLLVLGKYRRIKILSPTDFIDNLG